MLFFDGEDVEWVLAPDYCFAQVLRTKPRRAAQRGELYYTYQQHLDLLRK